MTKDKKISKKNIETKKNKIDLKKIKEEFFSLYKEKKIKLEEYFYNRNNFYENAENRNEIISEFAEKIMVKILFFCFLKKNNLFNENITWEILTKNNFTENSIFNNKFFKEIFNEEYLINFINSEDLKILIEIEDKFCEYNFILNEEYCEEKAVITPEIFEIISESSFDKNSKKSKGVFYTPKVIVKYMCRESILKYIAENINLSINEIKDFTGGEQKENQIFENAQKIDKILEDIKIVEPSIGGGAFVKGILEEIVNMRNNLTVYIVLLHKNEEMSIREKRSIYNLKKNTLMNSIYGVDISEKSVMLTKIQLWLEMAADDLNRSFEHSLIDYNIKSGDSLSYEENEKKLFDNSNKKNFFWKRDFKKVFEEKGGFDIVIGNPPYVGEKGNKELFREISESDIGKRFYKGRADLFYFFFHMGIDILRDKGILSFITTNYYITATSAKTLREDIKERTQILSLINFNELRIFDSAGGQHNMITTLQKTKKKENKSENIIYNGSDSAFDTNKILEVLYENEKNTEYCTVSQQELFESDENYIRLENHNENKIFKILEKLKKEGEPLVKYFNINQGIVSGADKVTQAHILKYGIEEEKEKGIFVITTEEADSLEKEDEKSRELIKNFYKNSDIKRYSSEMETKYRLIYITKNDNLKQYTAIEKHLLKFKKIIENKRETKIGRLPWYSIHWSREKNIFISPKIVAPQRSIGNKFAYNESEWFASADVYFITQKTNVEISLKYILALLNSKLFFVWLFNKGKRKGEMLELYAKPLEEIPIKIVGKNIQEKFIGIVDEIITIKGNQREADTRELEAEIDKMVYELYGLDIEERNIIERVYEGNK